VTDRGRAARLRRFAVNFYAAPPECGIEAFCGLLAARGIGGVGLTARALAAMDAGALKRLLDAHGLRCTSLNSTGYVLHPPGSAAARGQAALDDRLFAAAAALDAPINLIPGGLLQAAAPMPLAEARARSLKGIARLADRAAREGVRLSLEPMHPMVVGLRSCFNQIAAVRLILEAWPPSVMGLTLDLFHSWWDAELEAAIATLTARLLVVQVCGLVVPADGAPPRRAALSAGPPDLARVLRLLKAAGHEGPIEYEVFHEQMRPAPPIEALLDRAAADFLALTEASG
jgi:sugar phosphate isomerase/epimerase